MSGTFVSVIGFRLKIVYDGNSDRARSFAQNALCLAGCFFWLFRMVASESVPNVHCALFACNARFAAQVRPTSPLAAYFYLLIHLTTSPQFDTIRLYVIVVRYIFRRKTNKSVARGRVRNNKEKRYEKNLPTQKTSKKQSARFPRKNENNRRSSRACSSSQQGSSRTLRLIEAIREVYLQT